SFSLSDRSPTMVRYVAPAWWYGICEEFLPESLLPVSNEYDGRIDVACHWVRRNIVSSGFETGSLPADDTDRKNEPGCKGDLPYALFFNACRTGYAIDYDNALCSAYYFTYVAVDHSVNAVRMQVFPTGAISLPLCRVQACIAAYLETADP